jgi:hypothetical protein
MRTTSVVSLQKAESRRTAGLFLMPHTLHHRWSIYA